MNIFKEVKTAVTCREAAEHYGFHVSRNGMMRCPFHEDRTPSMKVDRNYICFGCHEKGDVIHFIEKLFNLRPYEAACRLKEDFHLTISVNARGKSPPALTRQEMRNRYMEERFCRSTARIYKTYSDYLQLLRKWRTCYAPRSPDEDFHPLFLESVRKTEQVEYLLDILLSGSAEEQVQLVIDIGKGVEHAEKRIAELKSEATG